MAVLSQGAAEGNGDTVGVHDPTSGAFYLRNETTSGPFDVQASIQGAGKSASPVVGDWDGDGTSTIGVYNRRSRTFQLRNRNATGPADLKFRLQGVARASLPIAGDWDADGRDTVGVYETRTGQFRLRNTASTGPAELEFQLQGTEKTWLPVTGDWDGNGISSVGLFDPDTGIFHLRNQNSTGPAELQVQIQDVGDTGDWLPVAGDWDGDGVSTMGRFNPRTGAFRLRNQNTDGPADIDLLFGNLPAGTRPLAGVWRGAQSATAAQLCVDTINAYRSTLNLAPLARWTGAEACADGQAEGDASTGQFHGQFGACNERSQNECPNWSGPPERMIEACLAMMWAEGPGSDFSQHGHYITMSNPRYTEVACGFYTTPTGRVWSVQDFR